LNISSEALQNNGGKVMEVRVIVFNQTVQMGNAFVNAGVCYLLTTGTRIKSFGIQASIYGKWATASGLASAHRCYAQGLVVSFWRRR
jgi:hypothetical protein